MITCIFGLCGSGKSLLLGKIASNAIAGKPINKGGLILEPRRMHYDRVYTNFLCPDAYKLDFDLLGFADYHDCLMIIDEAMLLADCRNFKSYGENLKLFFSQHRKKNITIVMATQAMDDLDKKIRNITDKMYYIDDAPLLPNTMRIRRIDYVFDIANCKTTYQYTAPIDNVYYYRPRLYKLIDTFEIIAKNKDKYFTELAPSEQW